MQAPLAHLGLVTPGTQLSDAPLWLLVSEGCGSMGGPCIARQANFKSGGAAARSTAGTARPPTRLPPPQVPIGLLLANGVGLFTAAGKEDERNF